MTLSKTEWPRRTDEIILKKIVALLFGVLVYSTHPVAGEKRVDLIGNVVDDIGDSIPGAYLTLKSSRLSEDRHANSMGSDGSFQFNDLPPGNDYVLVQVMLLSAVIPECVVVGRSEFPNDIRLKDGHVVDSRKKPLGGVRLSLIQTDKSWTTTSDRKGKFRFKSNVPYGKYVLKATLQNYATRFKTFSLSECGTIPAFHISLMKECD